MRRPAQNVRVTQIRTFPLPSESPLAPDVRALLQRIGTALDEHRPLRVFVRGLVALEEQSLKAMLTQENGDERQGKRRSATRSRQRAARRARAPGRSRE